ncbi:MAG: hypothetical protein EP299_13345 [Acidobacteria bacterium]|nr:MAG: hypothetical protein EP299_13345 [Acidobacteriota bacterium]
MRRLSLVAVFVLAITPGAAAQQAIEFSGATWTVAGEVVKAEDFLGQEALRFRSGVAYLSGMELENGTIELDVATTGHRSFVGVVFRESESTREYGNFYLRPHQSGRFDALQYTPVFNGISAWQLYPEHNASQVILRDQWLHLKLVMSGSRLEAFFDGANEPALVVENLGLDSRRGRFGLRVNFPAEGMPEDFYPAAFANVSVVPDQTVATWLEEGPPPAESGLISTWAISPAFVAAEGPVEELPRGWTESEGWTTATSDSQGRVNLARYFGLPEGSRRGTIFARLEIESQVAQVKRLEFGFSDRVSVFLNGSVLFTGDNTYRSRSERYLGVMTVDNDAIFLPLRKGRNELVLAVTEAFGGWGLIARLENLLGVKVTAAPPAPD